MRRDSLLGPKGLIVALVASLFVLVVTTAIGRASSQPAYGSDYTVWQSLYPGSSAGDRVVQGTGTSCQLCHRDLYGGAWYNAYGWEMVQIMAGGANITTAILGSEGFDSDGDPTGSTNLEEINLGTQPGWVDGPNNTVYYQDGSTLTNQLPPAGILGNLDPCFGSASELVRLGSPGNPAALLPGVTTPPIVGGVWNPVVTPFLPGAIVDFIGVDFGGPINVPTALGTLLIYPPPGSQTFFNLTPGTPFALAVPNDCTLIGLAAWAQGGSAAAGPNVALANGLDIIFGTYQVSEIIDAAGDGAGNALGGAHGIAVGSSGNVYVTGSGTDNAFRIAPGGVISEIIDATGDGAGNALSDAHCIAVDGSGDVYVAGSASDNVFRISAGGVITEIIDATGDGAGNTLQQPRGIATDGLGNVYVAGNGSDNVFRISAGGVITEIIDATGDGAGNPLTGSWNIAADAAGNVYVTGFDSDNAFEISAGGAITEILDTTGDGAGNTLLSPTGVAVDGSGNVYVSGADSDNVFMVAPGGGITEIIDVAGDGAGNPLWMATGVAVDGSGNVYVTGFASWNAFRIAPGGAITELLDQTGDGAGNGFGAPFHVALDGAGGVYLVSSNNNNAFRIVGVPVR